MAATPQPCFTVDAAISTAFDTATSRIALPGTPASDTVVRLINTGTSDAYVLPGDATVTVTPQTGVLIAPGHVPTYLGINGATYIAGITSGAAYGATWVPSAVLNIATGN